MNPRSTHGLSKGRTVLKALLVTVVGLGYGATFLSGAEKITLGLRLTKGQVLKQEISMEQFVTQTVQGQAHKIEQQMTFVWTQKVEDVTSDGVMKLSMTYDRVRSRTKQPMGEFEYDSDKPTGETSPQVAAFAALVGSTFSMDIKADGTVTGVGGFEKIFEKIMAKAGLPPGPMVQMFEKQLKQQFGDDAMKGMFEPVTAIYPDGPVAVGDSWNREVKVGGAFPHVQKNEYRLVGRKDGAAIVDLVSKIVFPKDAPPVDSGPMKMKLDLSGDQKGTLTIDEKTGALRAGNFLQKISGNAIALGLPGGQEMSIPMEIKGKFDVKTTN